MNFIPTEIPDVILIEPRVFSDARGFFMETFQAKHFANAGIPVDFVQDNQSGSVQGTLRGLHYQIRQSQGKLVRVIAGEVYDIVVDIRRSSPTFGKWVSTLLTAENKRQLWVPAGFAHGVYVISEWAELFYKATDYYAPDCERTIAWDDPDLSIVWPLLEGKTPLLSVKDQQGKRLKEAELFD